VLVCQTSQESKRILSPIWSEHEGNPVSTAITNHVPKRRSLRCQRTLEAVKCERILSAALSDEVKEKQNGCQPAQLFCTSKGRAPKRRSEEARNPSIKTGSDVCSHRRCEQLVWCQLASFRTHRQWQAKSPGCSSVTETLTQSHPSVLPSVLAVAMRAARSAQAIRCRNLRELMRRRIRSALWGKERAL